MRYLVELEQGEWLGRWHWTTDKQDKARRYSRPQDAKTALTHARKYAEFEHARIVEVEEVENG
jgi:hypothetical protein